MTEPVCVLCRVPGGFLGGSVREGRLHHGGERTQIVGWRHGDDDCTPILTTCYRAWVVYGERPEEEASS